MRRFITRKVKKKIRYKFFYNVCLVGIPLIIISNILIMMFFNIFSEDSVLDILVSSSYGNIYNNSNNNFFYKNLYGFDLKKDKAVFSESNINDLLLDFKENEPLIYIYNTFQTNKYKSNYYNSYNINPVITQASRILQEYLKLQKISSYLETKSVAKVCKDNNISYDKSYRCSRILLEEAKNNNHSLDFFIDLQMSDYNYDITTANIDGNSYAKILFVVGTDNGNYSLNQDLANSLNGILEEKYKSLVRGVSLRGGEGYQGVYNQDFNKNVLLIQVGGKDNTIDEVNRSLKALSEVFYEYLKGENNNENK
ncbi:MAG: hypothetical protein HFI36_02150 [Bacilli bacterium]|nr:hypothetical protein [Bacilli bacterium]